MKIQTVRRWAVVAAGLALLCGLPVIASALPVTVPQLTAGQLRTRILASADEPYAGYAESNATFGLPPVAGLTGLTSLLNGVTKMRVWQAAPDRWRVDVLSDAGERDTYQLGGYRSYIWDSGNQLLTEIRGRQTYRLPRPADLVPPALALRMLSEAGRQARFSVIAPLRVAGQSAAGLRVTPADPASTVGRVDIWADPSSGLPLRVEVFGRGSASPALESLFFQVSPWHPDPRVLTPTRAPGTGFTVTSAGRLAGALSNLALIALPAQLGGRIRLPVQPGFQTIGAYGGGLTTFVVLAVRGSAGRNLVPDVVIGRGNATGDSGRRGSRDQRAADQRDRRPAARVVLHLPAGRHGELAAARTRGDRSDRTGHPVVIITRALTKRYGAVTAVRSVDLDVREGDRYGLLGPNGSGKTTLVRMLLGLVYATSGEIEVLGRRIPSRALEVLPQIGALIEEPAAYPHLSGRTNLALLDAAGPGGRAARRTRRQRVDEALEQVGLAGIGRRPVKAYSLGMRQRLGLAAALIRRPRLLVLDEPGNGLDPRGIRDLRELLTGLNEAGVTVFLSSHLLAEVEQLCTRVGVLNDGRLVLQDDLTVLRAPTGRIVLDTPDADQVAALLDGQVEQRDGQRLLVRYEDVAALNARLVGAGLRVSSIGPQQRTLEEIVLSVTGTGSDQVS